MSYIDGKQTKNVMPSSVASTGPAIGAKINSNVQAVKQYLESLPPQVPFREEIKSYELWKGIRTEFLATLLVVILGCGSSLSPRGQHPSTKNCTLQSDPLDDIIAALSFGGAYGLVFEIFGGVSGSHANPVITSSMLILRQVSVIKAILHIIAQCSASLAASGILYGLNSRLFDDQNKLTWVTQPQCSLNASQAFGVEFLATFIVIIAFLYVTDFNKNSNFESRSLYVALSYFIAILFSRKYTGGSANPARSLGPAIVMNSWKGHWIYWVSPFFGSILAVFTYEYTKKKKSQCNSQECRYHLQSTVSQERMMSRTQSAISAIDETVLSNSDCRL